MVGIMDSTRRWLLDSQRLPDLVCAGDHGFELWFCRPAGGLAKAAVGGEDEAVGGGEVEAAADAAGDVIGGFEVVAFDVDDADGGVAAAGDVGDEFEFGKFAAGHFDVHFVALEIEERGEHGGELAGTDGAGFVVAEAEVGADAGAAGDGLDGAVEDVHEAARVFLVGVAAHAGFIDADFAAASGDEGFEFAADDRKEGFGQGPAVGVAEVGVGEEAAGEGVGAGH